MTHLRKHSQSAGFQAAVPALIYISLFFVIPVVAFLFVGISNGTSSLERALSSGLYLQVMWDTFVLGAIVTIVCLLLAYPVAYALTVLPKNWALFGFACLLLPFWTSLLVRTYAWMVLLGRNGIINQALLGTGIIEAPLPLLNNMTGVVIGMVHVLLPYMVFPLYGIMNRLDPAYLSAAEGLGALPHEVFLRIFLPLTLPGVLAGSILVFVLSIGFYITPALLGGGRVATIATLIEQQIREFLDWNFAAALSIVLLVATLSISVVLNRLLRGNLRWS